MKRRGLLGALLGAVITPVDAIAKALPAATPLGQFGYVSGQFLTRRIQMNERWMREMLREANRATYFERFGEQRPLPASAPGKTIKVRFHLCEPLGGRT